ncbi:MAG: formate/nitrite transporter family protein [Oscillospiraceae bacterium]|jgi:formate/nitrite transporter|nr:formate/nitrite transporter family protein [Oscillospiraceae bacterium]
MSTPVEMLEKWVASGKAKATNGVPRLFVLAILAGAFIAIAGVASATATVSINSVSPSIAKFVGACVFPGGLAMVLLAGSELFTGNTLILISVIHGETKVSAMLKNWVVVYIGNFIGSVLIAAAVTYGHTLSLFGGADGGLAASVVATAATKAGLPFGDALIRGILCNFLVCIAVWIASGANSAGGKLAGVFFPIMMFVLCGFEHSVANMYYLSAGWFAQSAYGLGDAITCADIFIKNLLPVTLGNIIGGCVFVACAYTFAYKKKAEAEK